jgi:hypothetical protein
MIGWISHYEEKLTIFEVGQSFEDHVYFSHADDFCVPSLYWRFRVSWGSKLARFWVVAELPDARPNPSSFATGPDHGKSDNALMFGGAGSTPSTCM